jgi:hypothetical protein
VTVRSIPTNYAGCTYRSRVEARWAIWFDSVGLRFQYEPQGFFIRSGAYLPDFWVEGWRMFLEVKGVEPTDEERRKCAELAIAAECDVLLAVGAPEERFQLLWFDRDGEREDRYAIARDKFSAAGFWLVSDSAFDDRGNWIGPNKTRFLPRGPMFSGALDQAFAEARSARFEHGEARARYPEIAETDHERAWHPSQPITGAA